MSQQVDRIDATYAQITPAEPDTLPRSLGKTAEVAPALAFVQPDMRVGFLTQNIETAPSIQLARNFNGAEYTISNQQNAGTFREQLTHIPQHKYVKLQV